MTLPNLAAKKNYSVNTRTLSQQVKDEIVFTEVHDGQFEAILPGKILSALIEGVSTLEYIANSTPGRDQLFEVENKNAAKSAVMKLELALKGSQRAIQK